MGFFKRRNNKEVMELNASESLFQNSDILCKDVYEMIRDALKYKVEGITMHKHGHDRPVELFLVQIDDLMIEIKANELNNIYRICMYDSIKDISIALDGNTLARKDDRPISKKHLIFLNDDSSASLFVKQLFKNLPEKIETKKKETRANIEEQKTLLQQRKLKDKEEMELRYQQKLVK